MLFEGEMSPCTLMERDAVPDTEGGMTVKWQDKEDFMAAVILDVSTETRTAAAPGAKNLYKILTSRSVRLKFHDFFRRKQDGKVFRVASGEGKETPEGSALDLRMIMAEEWMIK